MPLEIPFACPFCSSPLPRATFRCATCERSFPVQDGIPLLCSNPIYWNPAPRDRMQDYLGLMRQGGWRAGLRAMIEDARPKAREARRRIVLDETRTAWAFLLDLPAEGVVLDLGCGLGAISAQLAQHYQQVVGCDLTFERLQFAQLRARDCGTDNATYVCAGDTPRLPFPSGLFDTVVVNGVLEWVPDSCDGDPRTIQLEFLREVHRVLRPGGQLYLAIENRIGYEYFLGKPDNHSNLLYGSLLPRVLANAYSLRKRGKPYRTYTHTLRGYGRLFADAGFPGQRAYSMVPDYRHIEQIVDLNDASQMRMEFPERRRRSTLAQRLLSHRFYRHFAPSFGFVLSKTASRPRFLDGLVREVGRAVDGVTAAEGGPWTVSSYLLSEKGTAIVRLAGSRDLVLRIPLSEVARHHARRNAEVIADLHRDPAVPDSVKLRIPRPVCSGLRGHVPYYAEERIPGVSAVNVGSDSAMAAAVRATGGFITELHRSTANGMETLTADVFDRLIVRRARELEQLGDGRWDEELTARILGPLEESLVGQKVPLVYRMGDLAISNLIVHPRTGSLSGVVDWDRGERGGLPFLDVAHLIASRLRRTQGWSAGEALTNVLLPGRFEGDQQALVADYCDAVGLAPDLVRPLCLAWWVYFVWGRLDYMVDLDHAWMARNVWAVIDHLERGEA